MPTTLAHPLRGLRIGSMAAPVAHWAAITGSALVGAQRFSGSQSSRDFIMIVLIGQPIAWVVALVWGAPVIWWLQRRGWLARWTVVLAGAVGGTLVAVTLGLAHVGSLFQLRLSPAGGGALGALAGGACWWAGRAEGTTAR